MPTIPQTISYNLSVLNDANLLKYAFTLIDGIGRTMVYQGVTPDLPSSNKTVQSYATAIANFDKGGTAARMLRDELRTQVEIIIRAWSDYATDTTPNDPLTWAQAHFNLTKAERTPRTPLATPTKFVLADGPSKGSVRLSQNAQAGTKAYVYEYALAPVGNAEPVWHFCLGTTANYLISDLDSGAQYLFRVGVWNGTGNQVMSVIESRYVQ